jgi:hypothetical protein
MASVAVVERQATSILASFGKSHDLARRDTSRTIDPSTNTLVVFLFLVQQVLAPTCTEKKNIGLAAF